MTHLERIYIIMSILAGISLILLVTKFVTKRLSKSGNVFFKKADKKLMKMHKTVVKVLILLGALHGILTFSNFEQFGLAPYVLGIMCLLSCIGAFASFHMKKRFKSIKSWIIYHRFFAASAVIAFISHIVISR